MSDGQDIFKRQQADNSADYVALREVLDWAYDQASKGKGQVRHANNLPFTEQAIMTTCRRHGTGFATGQAEKKLGEAMGMLRRDQKEPAIQELLGAIVYTAAAILHINEGDE